MEKKVRSKKICVKYGCHGNIVRFQNSVNRTGQRTMRCNVCWFNIETFTSLLEPRNHEKLLFEEFIFSDSINYYFSLLTTQENNRTLSSRGLSLTTFPSLCATRFLTFGSRISSMSSRAKQVQYQKCSCSRNSRGLETS